MRFLIYSFVADLKVGCMMFRECDLNDADFGKLIEFCFMAYYMSHFCKCFMYT